MVGCRWMSVGCTTARVGDRGPNLNRGVPFIARPVLIRDIGRAVLLTMPRVTVFSSPNGLPTWGSERGD